MPEEVKDGQPVQTPEQPPVQEEAAEPVQGTETPEAMSTSNEPTEGAVDANTAQPQSEGEQLDPSVKERTKEQFKKLKAEKEALKKQLDKRSQIPSVLDFLSRPAPVVQPETRRQYIQPVQPPVVPAPVTSPASQLVNEDGYVNADVLTTELAEAKRATQVAQAAERRAMEAEMRVARFEQDAETKALYEAYPELDPMSEVFNKDAYDLVRNDIAGQLVHSGKRDAMDAAKRLSKFFRKEAPDTPSTDTVPKEVEQRNQASVPGTAPRQPNTSLQDLKSRMLSRDPRVARNATAERLKRIGQ
ncbi:hypothetical protein KAR91_80650 [Candidatus Pacearchaeota archaeon]|nr:hypothetical protein [Candidatus Pacearchaeota archaeon]